MTKTTQLSILLSVSLALSLTGCDSVRSTLGLDHYQADAFSVPTNPPLTLPPDYSLKPPAPGAGPAFAQTSNAQAQKTLNTYGGQAYSDNKTEAGLLTKVSRPTTENIRDIVDREAAEEGTLSGKMGKQVDSWSKQAKDNLKSISGDQKSPAPK